jgi:hypothetical protein
MIRVQIPAYTDRWMRGDRYGEITSTRLKPRKHLDYSAPWKRDRNDMIEVAYVKLDKSGETVRVILDDCTVVT